MELKRKERENIWVKSLVPKLESSVQNLDVKFKSIYVQAHRKIPYSLEIHCYSKDEQIESINERYETDLLFFDLAKDGSWIPRLVVECKLGSITTHDALTYSAKAATHKQVHPYLRYGILIGEQGNEAIPWRLFKHGQFFDFMATWVLENCSPDEWSKFINVVSEEIEASRNVQSLLSRSPKRQKYSLIHRPLILK